jgi:hypothetical protein
MKLFVLNEAKKKKNVAGQNVSAIDMENKGKGSQR